MQDETLPVIRGVESADLRGLSEPVTDSVGMEVEGSGRGLQGRTEVEIRPGGFQQRRARVAQRQVDLLDEHPPGIGVPGQRQLRQQRPGLDRPGRGRPGGDDVGRGERPPGRRAVRRSGRRRPGRRRPAPDRRRAAVPGPRRVRCAPWRRAAGREPGRPARRRRRGRRRSRCPRPRWRPPARRFDRCRRRWRSRRWRTGRRPPSPAGCDGPRQAPPAGPPEPAGAPRRPPPPARCPRRRRR